MKYQSSQQRVGLVQGNTIKSHLPGVSAVSQLWAGFVSRRHLGKKEEDPDMATFYIDLFNNIFYK